MSSKHSIKSILLLLLWGGVLVVFIAAARRTEQAPQNHDKLSPTTQTLGSEWYDTCANHRIVITGTGMTNGTDTTPLSVDGTGIIKEAWAQVAGRRFNGTPPKPPDSVTFTTDVSSTFVLTQPTHNNDNGYTFETEVKYANEVTAVVDNSNKQKLQRGLILYTTEKTTDQWTSIGKTLNEYVWAGNATNSYTEVFTIPELTGATDLTITAVVIDNNDDDRQMKLEAIVAGGVPAQTSEAGPTDGQILNITNLTLPNVPTGTEQVTVTLESPLPITNGDSLVLVGLNVSYRCEKIPIPGIYLPIIYKALPPPCYTEEFTIDDPEIGWPPPPTSPLVLVEYLNGKYHMATNDTTKVHWATSSLGPYTNYSAQVTANWVITTPYVDDDFGIVFDLTISTRGKQYYLFNINNNNNTYRLRKRENGDWTNLIPPTLVPPSCTVTGGIFTNTLKVRRHNSGIDLSINDCALPSYTDVQKLTLPRPGFMGVNIVPSDFIDAEANFDNFIICTHELDVPNNINSLLARPALGATIK